MYRQMIPTGETPNESTATFRTDEKKESNRSRTNLIRGLVENISIAGLREMVLEENPSVRVMFGLGLILITAFGVYESCQIITDHLREKTSMNIRFGNEHNYFPDVTVCSRGMPDTARAKELIKIPEEVKNVLRRLSIDEDTFLNDVSIFATTTFSMTLGINETLLRYKLKTMDAVLEQLPNGFLDWLTLVLPTCSQTLSKCTFHNHPIDCCAVARFVSIEGEICYQLDMNNYDREVLSGKENNETTGVRPHRSLEIDVQFDWSNVTTDQDDYTDGFTVTVAEPHTKIAGMPVAVASGWNAFIRLTRVTQTHDISSCVRDNVQAKYFAEYDDYGIHCMLGMSIDVYNTILGCEITYGTYRPQKNRSCTYSRYNDIRAMLAVEGVMDNNNIYKLYKRIALTYARGELCQPKCTRWLYFPMVSYAKGGLNDDTGTVSKSRITITISDPEFERHFEQPKESIYLLLSNVSGVMGTCIGISIVSFAQIAAYAARVCLAKRRPVA